jgi:hypothetical protein
MYHAATRPHASCRAARPETHLPFSLFVAKNFATTLAEAARPVPALPLLPPHAGNRERFRGLGTLRHMGTRS